MKDNTYLKRLILYADPLGVNNTKSISDAMIEGNFASGIISNLYVIGNNINDNGLVAIADALKANTVLTHLDIGKNVIKDPGALLLYAALSNQVGNANSAVEVLGLQWNYITNVGANLIAKLLTENNKIKLSGSRREVPVEVKFQKDIIWIIWDVVFTSAKTHSKGINKILEALLNMFCVRY